MPRLSIDGRKVEVPPGGTILDAARALGIDVPALCFLEGYRPSTSCLACVVRVRGRNGFIPSCATPAKDGMEVESETPEVRQVRKTALELLLSDHVGDCLAPCYFACPAHMDIPLMLRQITTENLHEAIVTVKQAIALPAVLGRICPGPCEKICRRGGADGPVAVCQLKRFAADADLASAAPYLPDCKPPTGKRVAIVGAGPTGLSAAYYLRREGHAVTIFDDQPEPGGRLLRETTQEELPREVLAAEIGLILRLGVELRTGTRVEKGIGDWGLGIGAGEQPTVPNSQSLIPNPQSRIPFRQLRRDVDAVLLACGAIAKEQVERWGLKAAAHGILVDKHTFQTNLPGIFAAGNAIRGKGLVVRSVADGREAAEAISYQLSVVSCQLPARSDKPTTDDRQPTADSRQLTTDNRQLPSVSRVGKLESAEVASLVTLAGPASRQEADRQHGFEPRDASRQAERCLHCDCRAATTCKLRRYAVLYGVEAGGVKRLSGGGRRSLVTITSPGLTPSPESLDRGILYEPGKCINCGLCIQIVEAAKEPLGLTFVGRGFDVRIAAPSGRSLEEALGRVAAECIAACPTAALAWKK